MPELINASFGAPLSALGFMTTRRGGVSHGVHGGLNGENGLNLGVNCGDSANAVLQNRASVAAQIGYPISWMSQVHGTHVHVASSEQDLANSDDTPIVADAMITTLPNQALGVLTADCLPVLLSSESVIGVAHAGWRGLSAGVLENTVAAMNDAGANSAGIHVWFGAAIGPTAFEVGEDVANAFSTTSNHASYFAPIAGKADKFWCDLYGLAREQLTAMGIGSVRGGHHCTVNDPTRFYSYRRDGQCGRMAGILVRPVD